jgi:DNA-binding transcriptional LysR family regulator
MSGSIAVLTVKNNSHFYQLLISLTTTMLNAARLRLLVELEDRGSLTAVADSLGYTPSAISQQLAKLELETGRRLLEPIGRGVLLSDAGRTLARHGREVLERLEAAEAALERPDEVSGTLRVAAFQTAAQALVVPALAALALQHPRLACELVDQEAETALPQLRSGELDLAVAEEYAHALRPRDPRLVRHELGPDELLVALRADHPMARAGGPVALADLADEAWATPWAGTPYASMVEGACRAAGFEPRVRHRVTDFWTLLDLARSGLAIAVVPALGRPQEDAALALRPVAGEGLRRTLFAAVRRGADARPAIKALIDALRERVSAA